VGWQLGVNFRTCCLGNTGERRPADTPVRLFSLRVLRAMFPFSTRWTKLQAMLQDSGTRQAGSLFYIALRRVARWGGILNRGARCTRGRITGVARSARMARAARFGRSLSLPPRAPLYALNNPPRRRRSRSRFCSGFPLSVASFTPQRRRSY
jgi:hypothetical protein